MAIDQEPSGEFPDPRTIRKFLLFVAILALAGGILGPLTGMGEFLNSAGFGFLAGIAIWILLCVMGII